MPFRLAITPEAKNQISEIMVDSSRMGLQKQLRKAFGFLAQNPKHPGLRTHPLQGSEKTLGAKVWTSYVQNNTPQAHRILWSHGKEKGEIVILAVIPHY